MDVVVIAGMIGAGKSSLTSLIGEELGGVTKYENLSSPLLPLLYTATKVDKEKYRYPFLLQLNFFSERFAALKSSIEENGTFAVLDRSIWEDKLFKRVLTECGEISELEEEIYDNLFEAVVGDLAEYRPKLTIYIRLSFEKVIDRIQKRSRDYEEIDEKTYQYFKKLWSEYDQFIYEGCKNHNILTIDGDKYDFVENESDRKEVVNLIKKELTALNMIKKEKAVKFSTWVIGKKVKVKAPWYRESGIEEGIVVESFLSHDKEFILNCCVEGRKNQISLYGESQWELIDDTYRVADEEG